MLSHVRQPKTVLDSGFNALDSEFQLLDSGLFVYDSGFRRLCFGFQFPRFRKQKQKFPDSEFRILLNGTIYAS